MEKKLTKFELARIKRTAQNVDQYVTKKNKLAIKVAEMQKEIDRLQELIDMSDAPVKLTTGGYGVEQLIRKVVTCTDKLDKNGNIIKQTSYEFIYPDTIIPPIIEPSNVDDTQEVDYNINSEVTDTDNFIIEENK